MSSLFLMPPDTLVKFRKRKGKRSNETWSGKANPRTVAGVHHIKIEDDHTRAVADPLHCQDGSALWSDFVKLVHGYRPVSQVIALFLQLRPCADSSNPDMSRPAKVNATSSPSSSQCSPVAELAPQVFVPRVQISPGRYGLF